MGFIDGTPLSTLVSHERPLDPKSAARIVLKLTAALTEAHDRGIVHRDLKPSNVMMDEKRREPVILDFGLARSFIREAYETQSGHVLGTPSYMSPEQARGATVRNRPEIGRLQSGRDLVRADCRPAAILRIDAGGVCSDPDGRMRNHPLDSNPTSIRSSARSA